MIQPDRQPTRLAPGEIDPVQPIDPTHPLTRGLEGLWLPLPHLTGGSQLYDLSNLGIHVPYTGSSPSFSSTAWSGTQVMDFRGVGEAFVLPNSSETEQDGDFTAFVHFQRTGSPGKRQGIFVDVRFNGTGDNGGYLIDYRGDQNGQYRFGVFNDGTSFVEHQDATTEPQTMCGTSDSSTLRLYQNGGQVASAPSQNPGSHATSDLKIGASGSSLGYPFEGYIQSALLFKRTLSANEVEYLDIQSRRGFPDLLNRRSDVGLLGGGGGGTTPISGTFALTDSQEQVSATGQTEVSGTLSVTDSGETLTVEGATIVSGAVSITDAGEIISAVSSLQDITGTAQITDAGAQVDATGEVKIAGTATLNDGTEEIIIVGENDITGSFTFADLAEEIAATGAVEVQGSLALTDAGEEVTARARIPKRLATVDVRLEDIIIVNAKLTD